MATHAWARTSHRFESQITTVPSQAPNGKAVAKPGPLGIMGALAVDSQNLYVAEASRIDEFNVAASPNPFVAQSPEQGSLEGIDDGLGIGRATGETEIYVGVKGPQYGVAAFQVGPCGTLACDTLQEVWLGEDTPNKSFAKEEEGNQVGLLAGVAVDGSTASTDWAQGDVFAAARSNTRGQYAPLNVIDVFRPLVDGGEEYVTQLKGTPLEGEPSTGQGEPFEFPNSVSVSAFNGDTLVVDARASGAVVDVFQPAGVGEYEFVGRLTPPSSSFGQFVTAIAIDGANDGNLADGDIYVASNGVETSSTVYEFNAAGAFIGSFAGDEAGEGEVAEAGSHRLHEVTAMALDPSSHKVFVADYNNGSGNNAVDVFSPNVTTPDVETQAAGEGVLEVNHHVYSIDLHGAVNPDGAGNATCWFVWGTSPSSLVHTTPCQGPGESAANPVNSGEEAVAVHAEIMDLEPGTPYFYRLEAKNAEGIDPGEGAVEFVTPGPHLVNEFVSGVASSSVTFDGVIAPNASKTSYRFEYDTSAYEPGGTPHGASVPASNASIGTTTGEVSVEQHIQTLTPSTTYHYRIVAVSEVSPGVLEEFYGVDRAFTTESAQTSSVLLDGRAWELVSPASKHGGLIFGLVKGVNSFQSPIQASANGRAMTYTSFKPTESGATGYSGVEQVFSMRAASGAGWTSCDISPPHGSPTALEPQAEYELFSEDLSMGVVNLTGLDHTLLSAQASEPTPYLHGDSCEFEPTFAPLVSGKEGAYDDVPPGTTFGGRVEFVGASPDMRHVVLRSTAQLTAAATAGHQELYEWSAEASGRERLALISMLPTGEGGGPANRPVDVGNDPEEVWSSGVRAVSKDGSPVFWSSGGATSAALYMRDVARGVSIRLDVPQTGAAGGEQQDAVFEFASADSSRVFFTDTQRLTQDASPKGADLYKCVIVEDSCTLSDLTPADGHRSTEVQNLVIGGEDGAYVYFVANGALPGSGAPPDVTQGDCMTGSKALALCNLYVYDEGAVRFIATLSSEDELDWGSVRTGVHTVGELTARVSSDGRFYAFMSVRPLTGYDNRDLRSGKPDDEVYLYDAQTANLVCVSCNSTGASPSGVEVGAITSGPDLAAVTRPYGAAYRPGTWVAGNLPAGTAIGLYNESMYQSRSLSDGGRLFFDSSDSLSSLDVNDEEDVYEFEPVGIGGCTVGSGGYVSSENGCVGLVSSGVAPGESGFIDASANGNDVFFLTGEGIVPEDFDTALDVYDARVCESGESCGGSPSQRSVCETADACRAQVSQQPPIYGPPSSVTFSGIHSSTVAGSAAKPKPSKRKRPSRTCRRRRGGRHAACKRRAKRQHGARSRRKRAVNTGRGSGK